MKKWNRLLSALMVFCMVFALMPSMYAAEAADKTYEDVPKDAWFYSYVTDMTKKGLVNGITETAFGPEENIQREQIVTILYRAAGIKDEDITWKASFDDVPENEYFSKPVAWAEKEKVVNGKEENKFDPEGSATREELVTILYRYTKAEAGEVNFDGFTDGKDVSDWAKDAFAWAVANKIIGGKPVEGGKLALDPQGNATRAESAKIFSVCLALDEETVDPTETEKPSETEEPTETEKPTETEPTESTDSETEEPVEDEFAIFNPANEKALANTAIPTGKYHNRAVMAVDAKLNEDGTGLTTAAADIALFTMVDHDTYVTFRTLEDMYLCTNGESGTELYYAATEDLPGTHFTVTEKDGSKIIGSEIAKFDGTGKCLEFFDDSFKLWGLDEGADTAPFAMKFLPVTENTAPVHTLEKVEAKAATETEPGNREHWKCSACGALFLDAEGRYPTTAEQITLPAFNTIPKGLALYNPETNTALSKTPKEYRGILEFEAVQNVRLSVDGKALYTEAPNDLLLFDKIETADGVTTFLTADSKYLAFDGTDFHLVDADTDGDTHFVLEDAGDNLKFIRSESYQYKETEPAYIRYNGGYNSKCFHMYKKAAVVATEFAFGFYPVEGTNGPAVSSVYINNQKYTCAVGSEVELDAGTYDGFTFAGWQCIGAKAADPMAAKTSFIVPDCKVEMTATWKNENKLTKAAELKPGDRIVITALDTREGVDIAYVFDVAAKNFCREYNDDAAPSCVFEVTEGKDGKIGLRSVLADLGAKNLMTMDANNGSIKHKIVFTGIGTDLTPVYDSENQLWKILTDIAVDKKGNETQKQMGVNRMKDGNMHFRSYNETNYTGTQPDQYGNYYFGDLVLYKVG